LKIPSFESCSELLGCPFPFILFHTDWLSVILLIAMAGDGNADVLTPSNRMILALTELMLTSLSVFPTYVLCALMNGASQPMGM
jgi:hypothetical protein